ncbi:MAG: SDR family NAD(P)-dependent oxidoreductase [Alphaproteobacteria bacterium]|nr:SDR family NAD(P)-dependent oxidoreductase [Alphaproteobacteria bacterium]
MVDRKQRLAGRIALVTGASRGIGAAVAERFAAEGADLILVARTVGGLEETDDRVRRHGRSATLVPLNLGDAAGIDRLAAAIRERHQRLDILVGNAGTLGTLTPLPHTTAADWTEVMGTNLTANWLLIRAFDPLLRAAPAGRAIFVTSGVTQRPFAYWGAYAISKTAIEAMVGVYAAELATTTVRVNLLDPGPIRTRMRAQAFPGEDPNTLRTPESIADRFVELADPACTKNGERIRA